MGWHHVASSYLPDLTYLPHRPYLPNPRCTIEPSQQAVSRILSPLRATTIPLVSPSLARSSDRPGGFGRAVRPSSGALSAGLDTSLFGLAPCGVLPATGVTAGAVRSYRTFSPLPRLPEAVCFLCHYPSSCPARALPGALPFRSSDFPLPFALSPKRSTKKSDRLADCDRPLSQGGD